MESPGKWQDGVLPRTKKKNDSSWDCLMERTQLPYGSWQYIIVTQVLQIRRWSQVRQLAQGHTLSMSDQDQTEAVWPGVSLPSKNPSIGVTHKQLHSSFSSTGHSPASQPGLREPGGHSGPETHPDTSSWPLRHTGGEHTPWNRGPRRAFLSSPWYC